MTDKPVGFAPGRYVRLKNDVGGLAAGARGMLSGLVLTRPEDCDKLEVVFASYIPGSPDYGTLSVPRENLEWDESEAPSVPNFPVDFPNLYGDALLAEILARDTALGPDYRALNTDEADRRILLAKLADAYRELDLALTDLERQ